MIGEAMACHWSGWLGLVWCSMSSGEGQAAATWGSAILSLLAILIALYVFIVEQRRANAERLTAIEAETRERQRIETAESDRSRQFLDLCVDLITEAIRMVQGELERIEADPATYVDWNVDSGVPHLIIPVRDSMAALQSIRQHDVKVVLVLSRTVRTLHALVEGIRGTGAPSKARALHKGGLELRDLQHRRNQFCELRDAVALSLAI